MRRTLIRFVKRSPSSDSTSDDARASSSPTTTIPSSSATTCQSGASDAPGWRVSAITSSMMSFATQSDETGTNARTRRSTIIAAV